MLRSYGTAVHILSKRSSMDANVSSSRLTAVKRHESFGMPAEEQEAGTQNFGPKQC
jgi:hypothetical protein